MNEEHSKYFGSFIMALLAHGSVRMRSIDKCPSTIIVHQHTCIYVLLHRMRLSSGREKTKNFLFLNIKASSFDRFMDSVKYCFKLPSLMRKWLIDYAFIADHFS